MPTDVERATRPPRAFGVHLGIENALFAMQGAGRYRTHRLDDDGIAVVDPFVGLEQAASFGKRLGHIVALHGRRGTDDPAACLFGDMTHCRKPALTGVPGRSDIDVDVLRIERVARERHVALPADERTDPPRRRIDDLEARSV